MLFLCSSLIIWNELNIVLKLPGKFEASGKNISRNTLSVTGKQRIIANERAELQVVKRT